jgi:hypothetical protein
MNNYEEGTFFGLILSPGSQTLKEPKTYSLAYIKDFHNLGRLQKWKVLMGKKCSLLFLEENFKFWGHYELGKVLLHQTKIHKININK